MARPDRKAGLLNFNINPKSISTAAETAVSFDPTMLIKAGIEGINKKLVDDDNINKLKLKGEYDRVHDKYSKLLSDPLNYRKPEELEKLRGEYENELGKIDAIQADKTLSEKSRTQLSEYNKTSKSSVDVSSELLETKQKFAEQQAAINSSISEDADGSLASAFDGIAGATQMSQKLNSLDETILSQVEAKNMTELDARTLFTETVARAGLTSAVVTSKDQIVNSNRSPEQKLLALNKLMKDFSRKENLDMMAKEISKGYKNTTKDALEVELNKQLDNTLGLIRKDMNSITTERALRKQMESVNKEKMLSIAQEEKYNAYKSAGQHWEAYKYKQDLLNKPAEFTKAEYLATHSKEFFGEELELANPTNRVVPTNQANPFTKNNLTNMNKDPWDFFQIKPGDKTQEEMFDMMMEKGISMMATDLGLDAEKTEDRIAAAKFLAGEEIGAGFLAPNGTVDYNLAMKVAAPDMSPISDDIAKEYKVKVMDNLYTAVNLDAVSTINSLPAETKTQQIKKMSTIVQNAERGIYMPETTVKGKSGTVLDNKFMGMYSIKSPSNYIDGMVVNSVENIAARNNIKYKKNSIEMTNLQATVLDTIKSSESWKARVQSEAIAIYQNKNPNFYADGNYLKGVSYDDLYESNSIQEAITRVSENILASNENYKDLFKDATIPYLHEPKRAKK